MNFFNRFIKRPQETELVEPKQYIKEYDLIKVCLTLVTTQEYIYAFQHSNYSTIVVKDSDNRELFQITRDADYVVRFKCGEYHMQGGYSELGLLYDMSKKRVKETLARQKEQQEQKKHKKLYDAFYKMVQYIK